MDPIEREERMKSVAFSMIIREFDQTYFFASKDQLQILKKTFQNIERYHFYTEGDAEQLKECAVLLEQDTQNFQVVLALYSKLNSLFTNYRLKKI